MNSDGCIQSVPYLESAAEITPAGIMIEPYGEHSFSELKKHYSQQAEMRSDAPAFLLKDMTLMSDLRAGLLACRKTKKSVYAVINVNEDLQTANELPADAALITLQSMGLAAFGISAANDEILMDGICRLASFAKIPIFAKLDRSYADALKGGGITAEFYGDYCICRTSEDNCETALMLANERQAFFLEPDTTELSEPISCEANMDEILCDASDEAYDVLKIEINTPDDVIAFVQDAHMATLPVMFSCEDDISLMLALMLYQGRALIDSECELDSETIEKAAAKYGAVVY